jgi:hypothetical protein
MDAPNDFEWAFPKAKNRASNGTLYDTHHVLHIFSLRRGSHCEIFQSVRNEGKRRCVNLTGYVLQCTLYPNICNKTSENYTQIHAVRKLVPRCAYLSRTEIGLTRVTIVC